MNSTYEWLYENYARALQPELSEAEDAVVEALAEKFPLTGEEKLDLADRLAELRLRCGTESFALGVRLGLELARPTAS